MRIKIDDVKPELDYLKYDVVCYILGVKPPFRIINGFIWIVCKKFGIDKVATIESMVFMVRFRSEYEKSEAIEAGPNSFDHKPVIMKNWSPDMDLNRENVRIVPIWIKFLGLPLKFWGQSTLTKLAAILGKPIKTDRTITLKDILEYARVFMEVCIDQDFSFQISFYDEVDQMQTQRVVYECKHIILQ